MNRLSIQHTIRNRDGVAVIVTLGLLAVITMMIFAFVLSMRSERLIARNVLDRSRAQHVLKAGLHVAIGITGVSLQQRNYPFDGWNPVWSNDLSSFLGGEVMQTPDCFGSFDDSAGLPELDPPLGPAPPPVGLFTGPVTNWVPAVLWDQAHSVSSYWMHVIATNEVDDTQELVGRVAFLVINCSGLVDAHTLTSNQCAVLPDVASWADFETDLERDLRYLTCAEMITNSAISTAVRDLFTVSYDPGPELFYTNLTALGTTEMELMARFPVNSLTNTFLYGPTLSTSPEYDKYHADPTFMTTYFRDVKRLIELAGAEEGQDDVEPLIWNLVNYLDADRVPQSDSLTPWAEPYGVEAVPLINEIALLQVDESRLAPGLSNHYEVAVEAWYPFVPESIDDAQLHVAIATNTAQARALSFDTPQDLGPFGFSTNLGSMTYGDETEFAVVWSPEDRFIRFPVIITRYDAALTPKQETLYLPIGAASYTTYELQGDPPVPVAVTRSVDNTVWLQSRVALPGPYWVDQAPGTGGTSAGPQFQTAADLPLALLDTVSLSINDPRLNGSPDDWTAGLLSATNAPSLGLPNPAATPWVGNDPEGGQGLPIRHADGALRAIGEMGFLSTTSSWKNVDLMSHAGGLLLDFFTAQPTNTPQVGRIHLATGQTNSIHALLSEAVIGWSNRVQNTTRHLTDEERLDLVEAVFSAREPPDADRMHRFGEILADIADTAAFIGWQPTNGVEHAADLKEDAFRHLPEQVTFRQNIFTIILAAQTLNPISHRVAAETRSVALVLRDAYTGRWTIKYMLPLDE